MALFHAVTKLDKVFAASIIIKGIDGFTELMSGFVLLFIHPTAVHHFITFITAKELSEDPHSFTANLLVHATQHFGTGSKLFAVIYLWIHGVIKLVAVSGILLDQLWAYPFSLITLGILTLYQVVTIATKASVGMVLLTIFDIFVLVLIWREYGKVKAMHAERHKAPDASAA